MIEDITHIRSILLRGKLNSALDEGLSLIKEKELKNDISKLKARLERFENLSKIGNITIEEKKVEENRISSAYFDFLSELEDRINLAIFFFLSAKDHYNNNEYELARKKNSDAIKCSKTTFTSQDKVINLSAGQTSFSVRPDGFPADKNFDSTSAYKS